VEIKPKKISKRKHIKQQNILHLLFSLIVIVLVSYVGSFLFARIDLTAENRYTLTSYTKDLLENLDDEVYVKVYLESEDLPAGFKRMQKAIKELLDEFRVYADNNVEYEFINAFENPDKKIQRRIYDELTRKGLKPVDLKRKSKEGKRSQQIIFPCAVVIYKGQELALNLLKNNVGVNAENNWNNSIQSLEYEFINGIKKLSTKTKPKVAFIEGHGELSEYQVMDITRTLTEYYEVVRGKIGGKYGILDNFEAIIIAKPRHKFEESDKFVIDQYIMKGGKVLWLIDPINANMDSLYRSSRSMIALANSLNLDDQLFKYGVRINPTLIQDLQCSPIGLTASVGGQPKIEYFPWYYFPVIVTQNNHHITKYMNAIRTEFVSTIDTVGASSEIEKTILLQTSKLSRLMPIPIVISLDLIKEQPDRLQYNKPPQPIAVLIEGKFESVFKNRAIKKQMPEKEIFIEKSIATRMIVIADGDIIKNEVAHTGEPYPLGFDVHTKQTYKGNSEFILNAVNYLCDDEELMKIRLREIKLRLLDKTEINQSRIKWQLINTVVPVFLIVLFGFGINFLRKRKYTRVKGKM
jgi:ABC-2 type transport system permease protein